MIDFTYIYINTLAIYPLFLLRNLQENGGVGLLNKLDCECFKVQLAYLVKLIARESEYTQNSQETPGNHITHYNHTQAIGDPYFILSTKNNNLQLNIYGFTLASQELN